MRVFVNAQALDLEPGASALDCVRQWKREEADEVVAGKRLITDSRGLPIATDSAAHPGSIYRTISNRAGSAE